MAEAKRKFATGRPRAKLDKKRAPKSLLERFEPMEDLAGYREFLRKEISRVEAEICEKSARGQTRIVEDLNVMLRDLWADLAKHGHGVMPYKYPKLASHNVDAKVEGELRVEVIKFADD